MRKLKKSIDPNLMVHPLRFGNSFFLARELSLISAPAAGSASKLAVMAKREFTSRGRHPDIKAIPRVSRARTASPRRRCRRRLQGLFLQIAAEKEWGTGSAHP